MVLAIGLLVDDAIVVVENVERLIQEEGLSPKEAARKSMDEISGALVAIAMVLAAVFLPMAFFGGSTGVIYRQFSLTIVSAMALSVLVALILSPGAGGDDPQARRPVEARRQRPARPLLPLVQRPVRSGAGQSRARRPQDHRQQDARGAGLRCDRRRHGLRLLAPPDRLHAGRGHRRGVHAGRGTVRRHPAAHRPRARARPGLFPDQGKGQCRRRLHRRRLFLRRPGAECRHRLRAAEAVGRAQGQGE